MTASLISHSKLLFILLSKLRSDTAWSWFVEELPDQLCGHQNALSILCELQLSRLFSSRPSLHWSVYFRSDTTLQHGSWRVIWIWIKVLPSTLYAFIPPLNIILHCLIQLNSSIHCVFFGNFINCIYYIKLYHKNKLWNKHCFTKHWRNK